MIDFICLFSLDIPEDSFILLALNGLIIVISKYDIYLWNHNTAQFNPFHFTDQEHLFGYLYMYLSDRKLIACHSLKNNSI